MFIWTLQDVFAGIVFGGLALFLVGLVTFEYGGRQLSRLVPIRPRQRWVDRQGRVHLIGEVTELYVNYSNRDGIHTFLSGDTIQSFRKLRMRYAGRTKAA